MPTFVLKKYDDPKEAKVDEEQKKEKDEKEELTITVLGTISEIVANALNKALKNTNVEIEEVEKNEDNSNIKIVSTEDINNDPISAFKFIKDNDVVFIDNRGFKTAKEDWYLTNIPNKTTKVFFTVEGFIKYITSALGIDNVS